MARLETRTVLGTAWSLFQVCLPSCLPLAVVAVAASATPGAESVSSGETHGFLHSREWWALCLASVVLTLICYGALLRQQLARASGGRAPLFDSLRDGARDVPYVLVLTLLVMAGFVPMALALALHAPRLVTALLMLPAIVLIARGIVSWPALIVRRTHPWGALLASVALTRGRGRELGGVLGTLLLGILTFVLLTGILLGMVMGLAGQGTQPTAGGLAFSRWLLAIVLALPVVYVGAVSVTIFRTLDSSR